MRKSNRPRRPYVRCASRVRVGVWVEPQLRDRMSRAAELLAARRLRPNWSAIAREAIESYLQRAELEIQSAAIE